MHRTYLTYNNNNKKKTLVGPTIQPQFKNARLSSDSVEGKRLCFIEYTCKAHLTRGKRSFFLLICFSLSLAFDFLLASLLPNPLSALLLPSPSIFLQDQIWHCPKDLVVTLFHLEAAGTCVRRLNGAGCEV